MRVGHKTHSIQVQLLCIHVDFELLLGRDLPYFEHEHDRFLFQVSFVLLAHLYLFLLGREFVCFIPVQVLLHTVLNDLLHLLLAFTWVGNGFLRHHFHVVFQRDAGLGRWHQAQRDFLLFFLFLFKALFATQFLLFLLGQVKGD